MGSTDVHTYAYLRAVQLPATFKSNVL